MNLYPTSTIGNNVGKMIQSKHVSGNDLRSFSFGSFQTSLMTSCVPPFQCGSLPKSCGSSSVQCSRKESLSQHLEEQEATTKSDGNSSSDNLSSEEKLSNQYSFTCGSEHVKECQKKQVVSVDASSSVSLKSSATSDVVITQPTSGETASSHENLSFKNHNIKSNSNTNNWLNSNQSDKQFLFSNERGSQDLPLNVSYQNDISNIASDSSNRKLDSLLDLNIQEKDSAMPTSTECTNHNSLCSFGISDPTPQYRIPNLSSRDNRVAEDNYPQGPNNDRRHPLTFRGAKRSKNKPSETTDIQQRHFSDVLSSDSLREGPVTSASSSGISKIRKEVKRSSKKCSSKDGSRAYGYSRQVGTQKLFTPEDLSNDLIQPNPPGCNSEIYQNFNAKEADFVLHRPRRKPRKVPLPPKFMITVGLKSDLHKVQEGLIEPLATEDEVALSEGTKEFIKNGLLGDTDNIFHNTYDLIPCEAVNFALENSIDNFDREEYVRFKKANDLDMEVPNTPESSYFLHSLIIKPDDKKVQLDISKSIPEMYSFNMDNIDKKSNVENDIDSVPKCLSSSPNVERDNENNTPTSRGHDGTCLDTENLRTYEQKVPNISNIINSMMENNKSVVRKDYINQFPSGKHTRENKPKATEPLYVGQSIESATKRTNYDFPKSSETNLPFSSFSIFGKDLPLYENSSLVAKPESHECPKHKSESKYNTGERHRQKKSTKLYKNIKYYKITNHPHTSFDDDSKVFLNGDDVTTQTPDCPLPPERSEGRCTSDDGVSTKRKNPLSNYSTKGTQRTTMDILEEVQSNLRTRLASLEDLDALVENITEGDGVFSREKSLVPYKPLEDMATSITPTSFTPPSSSSPSSMRDWFLHTGATRKESKRKMGRSKKRGRRDCDDPVNIAKALYKRPSPSWSSSASSSSSSDDSSLSLASPKSSSMTSTSSSSSSSSSSSDSTSSSSIDSSDIEGDPLI